MIIRAANRRRFTNISNVALEDKNLSLKAKGLLAYILSKPDGWEVSERHLAAQFVEGRDAVRSGLKELEAAGYFQRERVRREDGTFQWVSQVCEEPWSGYPAMVDPVVVDPVVDNPTRVNTEVVKTEVENRAKDEKTAQIDSDFDAFWKIYPRKIEKQKALKAYRARRREGIEASTLLAAVKGYAARCEREGTGEKFIKHGATFLGPDRVWEDSLGYEPPRTEEDLIQIMVDADTAKARSEGLLW